MVFLPDRLAPELPPIPDSVPLHEFMLNEKYGRHPLAASRDPFTCGLSKKSYSTQEVAERVELLARAISKELNWQPNRGTEWDKTMGVFALNSVGLVFGVRLYSVYSELTISPLILRSMRCRCSGQFIA